MCTQSLALCLIYGDQLINSHISVMVGDGCELDFSTVSWIRRGDGWKSRLSPLLALFCFKHVD